MLLVVLSLINEQYFTQHQVKAIFRSWGGYLLLGLILMLLLVMLDKQHFTQHWEESILRLCNDYVLPGLPELSTR